MNGKESLKASKGCVCNGELLQRNLSLESSWNNFFGIGTYCVIVIPCGVYSLEVRIGGEQMIE